MQTEAGTPASRELEQAQAELRAADIVLGDLLRQLKIELPTAIQFAQRRFSAALAQVARCKDAVTHEEQNAITR